MQNLGPKPECRTLMLEGSGSDMEIPSDRVQISAPVKPLRSLLNRLARICGQHWSGTSLSRFARSSSDQTFRSHSSRKNVQWTRAILSTTLLFERHTSYEQGANAVSRLSRTISRHGLHFVGNHFPQLRRRYHPAVTSPSHHPTKNLIETAGSE